MTLLSIGQEVEKRLKLDVDASISSGVTITSRHLFALANEEGDALAKRTTWQVLRKEMTFSATAAEQQAATAIPDDWQGRFVPETFWNRSRQRRLVGPLTPQEWQAQKATVASAVFDSFTVRGNLIYILPVPTAGHTYAYEYVSTEWARNSSGDPLTRMDSDDDYPVLDEEIFHLGVIWRWKAANDLSYAEDFGKYEKAVKDAMGRDGMARALNFSCGEYQGPITPGLQDGSWNRP